MKLLFITTKCPYPPREGMTLRTYNLINQAAKYADIYLLSLIQDEKEFEGLEHLKTMCKYVKGVRVGANRSKFNLALKLAGNLFSALPFVCAKYDEPEIRNEIRQLRSTVKFDAVHLDLLPLAVYQNEVQGSRIVMVEHNIESSLLLRRYYHEKHVLTKIFLYFQYLKLRRYESKVCNALDCTIVVSEVDKADLLEMSPRAKIEVVPNGTSTEFFKPGTNPPERNTLIFVGGQNWHPNSDGLRYFFAKIFQDIVAAIPDIKLYVIGKKANNNIVPEVYQDNVIQTGIVDDIRPWVERSAIFVVPLRVGGGTRLKILDAMAMGKAIVSTSIGSEGIDVVSGQNIVVVDDPKEFSEQIVKLLKDPQKIHALGESARKTAMNKYDWNIVYEKMRRIYSAN